MHWGATVYPWKRNRKNYTAMFISFWTFPLEHFQTVLVITHPCQGRKWSIDNKSFEEYWLFLSLQLITKPVILQNNISQNHKLVKWTVILFCKLCKIHFVKQEIGERKLRFVEKSSFKINMKSCNFLCKWTIFNAYMSYDPNFFIILISAETEFCANYFDIYIILFAKDFLHVFTLDDGQFMQCWVGNTNKVEGRHSGAYLTVLLRSRNYCTVDEIYLLKHFGQ